jgi:two-component system cell cycle sensor histidine kinase/response regulator CckA
VEDEEPVRRFSARALRNTGYEVLEAPSGDHALALLEAEAAPIDLLITDMVMPGIDGATLIERLRSRGAGMRVICMSGYAEDSFRRRLDGLAGVHFLAKPFTLKQLAAKVQEVLGAAA